LSENVVKDLVGDATAIAELEKEWEQLQEDRIALRQIFPTGDNKA
jgi:DNA-directed RNA polymerase II subunit RPB1